jgi:hypothetical protein
MNALTPAAIEPEPIEIERCELCGCAIEDLDELIYLRAADLIAQWELADTRDAWRHNGEHPPRSTGSDAVPLPQARPYRTPQATIDAFWYVVRLDDPDYLTRWLAQHPLDASALCELWEGKNACA